MKPVSQDEYATCLERANLWKMRAKVATALAKYFCETSNYVGGIVNIDVEVDLQSRRLLKMLHETENGSQAVRRELTALWKK